MYGYAFGAARANVSHIVRGDTMLYPGYEPRAGLMPTILHYGSDYTIVNEEGGSLITPKHGRSTYFNKMGHKELDLYACRDHNERAAQGVPCLPTSQPAAPCIPPATPCIPPATPCIQPATLCLAGALFFFDAPPPVVTAEGKPRSTRDILITQHLQLLNAAFCGFYRTHCGALPAECPAERATPAAIAQALRPTFTLTPTLTPTPTPNPKQALRLCVDGHESCSMFAAKGECLRNPSWMMSTCARSCGTCRATRRPQLRALLGTVARHGPLVPVPAHDALGHLLRRHARQRQGRAALQRLAVQHGCGEACTFFGVRVRYGPGLAAPSGGGGQQGEGECAAGEGGSAAGEGGQLREAVERRMRSNAAGAAGAAGVAGAVGVDGAAAGGGEAGALPHRLSGEVGVAEFGAGLDCLRRRAPLRLGEHDGCDYSSVPYSGSIVLLPRGGCSFVRKAMYAQAARYVLVVQIRASCGPGAWGCTHKAGHVGLQPLAPTVAASGTAVVAGERRGGAAALRPRRRGRAALHASRRRQRQRRAHPRAAAAARLGGAAAAGGVPARRGAAAP